MRARSAPAIDQPGTQRLVADGSSKPRPLTVRGSGQERAGHNTVAGATSFPHCSCLARRSRACWYTTRRDEPSFLQCCAAGATAHDVHVRRAGIAARNRAAGHARARAVSQEGDGRRGRRVHRPRTGRHEDPRNHEGARSRAGTHAEADRTRTLDRELLSRAGRRSVSRDAAAGDRNAHAAVDRAHRTRDGIRLRA